MMYRNILFILLFTFCLNSFSFAQELRANVTVISNRIPTTVDKKIFTTLQTQLNNFLNTRRWSNDVFKDNEKIVCNFLLNLESIVDQDVYKGSLTIQAARPVYNSSYQTAIMNFMDADFTFKYVQYQPVEFNENRVQGSDALVANLTAIFAYYANMIIGLDYDSFSPNGGQAFFQKAQNIVNNAPEGKNISGWRVFDGLRNRYFLVENLINTKYNIVHDVMYGYYRNGLDKMYDTDKEARSNVLQSLAQLQNFNKENPNTMFVQFFMQSKSAELIGIFKNAEMQEKQRVIDILSFLDVANITKYREQLR